MLADLVPEAHVAADAIRRRWDERPRAALILGTGLGNVARAIEQDAAIAYDQIPHFPRSTALAHRGQLVCGRLGGAPIVAMEGRCHRYEGYALTDLTLPVYTFRALGAELIVLSNASGGLNPQYRSGDVLVIDDHIDLMFWPGPSAPARCAVRPYDTALIDQALAVARRENFVAHQGVYVAMTGPNYETRAEYRFLRKIGGDAVGMSTVPEAIAAVRCGLRTLALSAITNLARPDCPRVVLAQDVVSGAERAEPNLRKIMVEVVSNPWPPAHQRSSTAPSPDAG